MPKVPGRAAAWGSVALVTVLAAGGAALGSVTGGSTTAISLPRHVVVPSGFNAVTTTVPALPAPGPVTVDGAAWAGHGELAFVSDGRLEVLSDTGALTHITGPVGGGFDSSPAWSPDDRWLAFLHTGVANGYDIPAPTLWLVASGTARAREVTAGGVGMFAWSPVATVLAYTDAPEYDSTAPVPQNLWFERPGSSPTHVGLGAGNGVGTIAWEPDGAAVAFDDTVIAHLATATTPYTPPVSRLGIVSMDGGTTDTAYRMVENAITLAGWWPDGDGLLFWEDPGFAEEADGEVLYSLALGSSRPSPLVASLVGSNWVSPEPGANTVAVVAGRNRDIRAPGHHVDLCRFPAATCRAIAVPANSVGLAPRWAASGTLVFAVAPASPPWGPDSSFTPSWMAAWDEAHALWEMVPGGQPDRLAAAPTGALLGVPARAGDATVMVADDALWLSNGRIGVNAVMVAGPLFSTAGPSGYYAEVDWAGTFSWSDGTGVRQGSAQLFDAGFFPGDPQVP